ncbi:MAG: response regulator [Candidatus Nitrospinota bacterium M3_3B_026]
MINSKSSLSGTSNHKSFHSIIKRNYLFALVLIAVISCAGYAGLYMVIKIQTANAAMVNVSGRQRMLSQRAAFYAHNLAEAESAGERKEFRAKLLETADEMETSHAKLIMGDPELGLPGSPSRAVRRIFFEKPVQLEKNVRQFIADLRALAREPDSLLTPENTHLKSVLKAADAELLEALETLTAQYQGENEEKVYRMRLLGMGALGVIIFVLIGEDLFIFRPMSRRVEEKARKLVENEKRLRDITAALGEGVYVTDKAGRLVFMNPEAERLTGWSEDEFLGKSVHDVVHFQKPDGSENPFENCAIYKTLKTGEVQRVVEDIYTKKDGTLFPISLTCSPIVAEDVEITGTVVAFHDITGRKKAEDELRRRAELIHLQQEITIAANESPTVDDAMRACLDRICRYTGWEVGHVYIVTPENTLAPAGLWCVKDQERFGVFIDVTMETVFQPGEGLPGRVFESGRVEWITDVLKDSNFPRARKVWELGVKGGFAFPVLEGDKVTAVLEFFTTVEAAPDQSLLDALAGVATQLGRATERKRAQDALREAKEKAEKATELKDKFVSLVTHDLRSPMATVIGFLDAVTADGTDPLSEKHKKELAAARRNLEGLLNLIDRLLNITRLRTGRIRLDKKFIDGRGIAYFVVRNLSHAAEKKGITLENNVPKGLRLCADPDLFGEVILNLAANAIKFCRNGDRITLFTPPDNDFAIAVKDTGVGIAQEMMPDIFKHEVKTSGRGTAGEKGTGLGLPFCHDIMEAHGGSLKVESKEGEGCLFIAELPPARPVVLVVDDDETIRHTLKGLLEKMDMEVLEAENGKKAAAILNEKKPHIILLDIIMPVMDGFELLRRLKENPEMRSIPVVVVTIDNEEETSEKAFRMGVNDVLYKPLSINTFIPKVRRLLLEAPRFI